MQMPVLVSHITLRASNAAGQVTYGFVVVSVPPITLINPSNASAPAGTDATWSVTATGPSSGSFDVEWWQYSETDVDSKLDPDTSPNITIQTSGITSTLTRKEVWPGLSSLLKVYAKLSENPGTINITYNDSWSSNITQTKTVTVNTIDLGSPNNDAYQTPIVGLTVT
jgi:hypothetical protein